MFDVVASIQEALDSLPDSFLPGELAYVAITGKPESLIRDRLAYLLHLGRLGPQIHRELSYGGGRFDIAIRAGTAVVALLELKVYYAFDVLRGRRQHKYPDEVRLDLRKMHEKVGGGPEKLALLLITQIDGPLSPLATPLIKYGLGSAGSGFSELDLEIRRRMEDVEFLRAGTIPGGSALGGAAFVHYWLLRYADQI